MADRATWEDGGVLHRAVRRVLPRLPGPRIARALLGAAAAATALAYGEPVSVAGAAVVVALLVAPAGRSTALDWAVMPLLRAVEYSTVVWLAAAWAPDDVAAAYAVLAATSLHHYDLVYRARYADGDVPTRVALLGGGYEVRMLAVALLALDATDVFAVGCWLLCGWLTVIYAGESLHWWRYRRLEHQEGVR